MRPLNAVVAQCSTQASECLIKPLHTHFRAVHAAHDLQELRTCIAEHRADIAIIDLEMVALDQLRQLASDYAGTTIICTHRLADEQLWAEALAAGAVDCCHSFDVRAIVLAASRHASTPHAA
jgi:DNA-binding NarL/FixJ family response regulator